MLFDNLRTQPASKEQTMTEPTELLPCPFCGAGESQIHVNKGTWNGRGYGEPVSVEVRHWCADVPGQPSRMISRAGRDEASAIAAWNTRTTTQPQAGAVPLTCEWAHNEDDGFWETACGEAWRFDDGGPGENNMRVCPCGFWLYATLLASFACKQAPASPCW